MAFYTFFLVTLAFHTWPMLPVEDSHQCGDFHEVCHDILQNVDGTFAEYGKSINNGMSALEQMSGIFSEEDANRLKPILTRMLSQLVDKQREQMELEPFLGDLIRVPGMDDECLDLLEGYYHKILRRVRLDWSRSQIMVCMVKVQDKLCHFERLDGKLARIHQLVWPYNRSDVTLANEVRKTLRTCTTPVRKVKEWAMAEAESIDAIPALKEVMDTQEMIEMMREWVIYMDSGKPLSKKISYTERKLEVIKGIPNTRRQQLNMERALNDLKKKLKLTRIKGTDDPDHNAKELDPRSKETNSAWDEDFDEVHPKGGESPEVFDTTTLKPLIDFGGREKGKAAEKEEEDKKFIEERQKSKDKKSEEEKVLWEKGTNKGIFEEPSPPRKGLGHTPRKRQTRDIYKAMMSTTDHFQPTPTTTISRMLEMLNITRRNLTINSTLTNHTSSVQHEPSSTTAHPPIISTKPPSHPSTTSTAGYMSTTTSTKEISTVSNKHSTNTPSPGGLMTFITHKPWTIPLPEPTPAHRIGRRLVSTTDGDKPGTMSSGEVRYQRESSLTAAMPRIFFNGDRTNTFDFNGITDYKTGNGHEILQKLLSGSDFFAEYPTIKISSGAASTTEWVFPLREESGKTVAFTPCHILSTHDHYCIGIMINEVHKNLDNNRDLDRNHYRAFVTNMDICTDPCRPKKKFATRVVASTTQICEVGDIEVDVPIMFADSAGEVTNFHHSLHIQGAGESETHVHDVVVPIRQIHLCFTAHCEIEVIPSMSGLTFKFTSSGTAMWEYAAGEHHDHGILHAQSVMYNIELPEWGDITYFLRCNKNSERNTKTFSKHEYCRSYSHSWEFWFCMNQDYCWFIFCALMASILVHFFSCWIAALLGYIVCFVWAFFKPCFKRKNCTHCGRVCFANKLHLCPSECDYCGIKMGPEHFKNCAMGKENNDGYVKTWRSTMSWGFVSVYASGIKKYVIYAIMGFIWVAIIASFPGTIKGESSSISSVSVENEIINLVRNHGFTLMKGLMRKGEFTRQGLTVTSANKECEGDTDCKLTTQLQTRLRVEPDFQAGFLLTKPGLPTLQHKFDVRVHNTWDIYDVVFQYYGCESKMVPHNADTCTRPVSACFAKLANYPSVGNHSLAGTSSWSCDGFGCLSIGQGATCMKCHHIAKKSTCMAVYSLGTRTSVAEICYVVQNQGACKNFTKSTQITDNEFGFMLDDEPDYITDTTQFAVRRGFPVRGSINPKDMFATRFSSIQYNKNYVPSCHPDILVDHICAFSQHRYFKVRRCCKDTFNYEKDLVVQPHWHLTGQKLYVEGPKLGMATLSMLLSGIDVSSIIEAQEVTMFVISSMTGCYNCHIGGLMTITVTAMRSGPTTMTCDNINLKHGDFSLKSGSNDYHFHFTSNNQEGTVACTIVGKTAKYTIELEEPPKTYHGDATINTKSTFDNGDDCDDSTLCQFTQGFVNFFDFITGPWWVTMLKSFVIIIIIVVFLWLLFKIIQWASRPRETSKLESTKSLFKSEKKIKNL